MIRMRRRGSPLQISRALIAGLFPVFLWVSFAVSQTGGDRVASDLRQNVVRIESQFRNGKAENGFGFVVGEKAGTPGTLYVVTAYHVVNDKDEVGPNATAKVRLEFFGMAGQMFDASLLGTHDANRDLAVLTVPTPRGFAWTKKSLAGSDKQKRGTAVWYIGRDRKWNPPISPGHVLTEPSTEWLLELEGLGVKPGSSGGPVLSDTGIIGMIQTDSEQGTQALSIDFIKKIMQEWNHPWQLELYAIPNQPVVYSPQADNEAIRKVIDAYRDAYIHIDSKALWAIWPSASSNTKSQIEAGFNGARSIKLDLKLENPEIAPDHITATVKGHAELEQTPKSGGPRKSSYDIKFILKKTGGTWKLDDVQ